MAESPSETSSDDRATFSTSYVKELEENLHWHVAILAVVLQEAGGVVEINAEDLAGLDLSKAKAEISHDPERNIYRVEGLYEDE